MATTTQTGALRRVLEENVREGELYEKLDRGFVRCFACGHCCRIPDGQLGVCKVRFNRGGQLFVPWGYVGGVQCDPVEKKPFFHASPGALAYSFGMLGCDLHCSYCQNWVTSQALRDPQAVAPPLDTTPQALVQDALREQARILVSTYNEPLITSEWAVDVFTEARKQGLVTGFVSNGHGTPRVLLCLRRKSPRTRQRLRTHFLSHVRREAHRPLRLSRDRIPAHERRRVSPMCLTRTRPLERRVRRPTHGPPVSAPRPHAFVRHLKPAAGGDPSVRPRLTSYNWAAHANRYPRQAAPEPSSIGHRSVQPPLQLLHARGGLRLAAA